MYEWGRFFIYDLSNAKYAWHISFKPSSPNFKWLHWFLSTSHINVMHLTVEVNQKSWISITFQIYIYLWPKLRCEMRTFSPIYNMQKDVEWKPQPKFQKLHWKFTGWNMKSSTPGAEFDIAELPYWICQLWTIMCRAWLSSYLMFVCSRIRITKIRNQNRKIGNRIKWNGHIFYGHSVMAGQCVMKFIKVRNKSDAEKLCSICFFRAWGEWVSEWVTVCVCMCGVASSLFDLMLCTTIKT